ncbi:MAG: diguanylate cyclase [Treponema sp.]|jgi:diguanylate cyclase (GGDEF)-like protein|nr:diguanylate cyclase [Treponema sp.]
MQAEEEEKFRILIVNSDSVNIALLSEVLEKDYAITFAQTGAAALKRAEETKPDMILLDVLLPDANGFDLFLNLKTLDEDRESPVIFTANFSNAEDEEKGLMLGAVDYIAKPFNNAVIRARVGTQIKIIKQIRTIERLGFIDALTDIPNRRCFDIRIRDEWRRTWRRQSSLSILMLDVDKFKVYNDSYGHPQGDKLLQFVGKTLTSCIHRSTDMAARMGGEEFAIILGDTNSDGAAVVAENIRSAIEKGRVPHTDFEGIVYDTSVTVSIGINSLVPGPELLINEFIQKADKNLYVAKETGRNRVVS